jgi:hypothetical protein
VNLYKAGDILLFELEEERLEIEVVLVKAHQYTLKASNYKAAYRTWDLDHEQVHNLFRKLTKLDKALK